jgi:DNA-binding transcriptional ArsR family regulator
MSPRRTMTVSGSMARSVTQACEWSGFPVCSGIVAHFADYEAEDVLVVSEPEQLRAVADDLRAKIIALLRERARSTQDLAQELGVPKGTVGHHLKVLERARLIRVVRTRKVRAMTEKFYGRTARLFLYEAEQAPETVPGLSASMLRQAADEVGQAPAGVDFAHVRARLTESDARRLGRRLDRLVKDFRAAEAADGVLHSFTSAFWSVEKPDA